MNHATPDKFSAWADLSAPEEYGELLAAAGVGDALSVPLGRRLLEARPGKELYVTYGLTEAGPRVSTLSAHAEPPPKWHTVGLPLSGVRVRVRGGAGERGGPLSVQTPSAMLRRVGPVERHRGAGADGWLETGDVFRRDEVMGYRLVLHLHPSVKPGQLDLRFVVRRLRFAERPSEVTVVESTPEGQYK